jgi:hypothetical protein
LNFGIWSIRFKSTIFGSLIADRLVIFVKYPPVLRADVLVGNVGYGNERCCWYCGDIGEEFIRFCLGVDETESYKIKIVSKN